MKKYFAFILMAATLVACTEIEQPELVEKPDAPKTYTMTVKASKDVDTKALTLNGSTLTAKWAENEEVKVYEGSTLLGSLYAQDLTNNGVSCSLRGSLNNAPSASGVTLTLKFNTASYSGQDGTLGYIASHCDYAEATTTVTIDGSTITGTTASFTNHQAIVKFTLVDKADATGNTKLSPSKLTVTADFSAATKSMLQQYMSNIYNAVEEKLPYESNLSIDASTYNTNGAGVIYLAIPDKIPTNYAIAKNYIEFTLTASVGTDTYSYTRTGFPFENGKYYEITVKMSRTFDLDDISTDMTLKDGDVLTGTLSANKQISIADGATVTLDNVSINADGSLTTGDHAGITCLGDATIILKDGTTNTVKGFSVEYPGIQAGPTGTTLTIQGGTAGTGILNASSNGMGAGIGGSSTGNCGDITIEGGTINASGGTHTVAISGGGTSSSSGAGIGSGAGDNKCGDINIKGGTITAYGGLNAAGIGSGMGYSGEIGCGDINISGGVIRAIGGDPNSLSNGGAGIGCGYNSYCGAINITGGTIAEATGGGGAAGIGGGNRSSGNITIKGGSITANGGSFAPGIGCHCGNITIEKTVTKVYAKSGEFTTGIPLEAAIGKASSRSCGTIIVGEETMFENDVWTIVPTTGGHGGLNHVISLSGTNYKVYEWTITQL